MGKRLYIGNLPYDADEDAIRAAFAEHGGSVERVHIPLDRETQRPRGFAFVELATEEQAQQAIAALNGASLGNRTMRVSEAEERRPTGGGGARSGGYGRRSEGAGSGVGGHEEPGGTRGAPGAEGRDPAERARENRERRFGPDARPGRERDRGPKSKGGHGRRRHEDAGDDRGRRGGSRFDDYDD
ncbi:MAG: RNA recognition motif domain-containing protein [Planctomycetota bacterium]